MSRRFKVLVICALLTPALFAVAARRQAVPTGFQFHSRVTVLWSKGITVSTSPGDLRQLIDAENMEMAVRTRMLAENGRFLIRPGKLGRSAMAFDVFTANDWWFGKVEEALQEECKAQVGREAPSSLIGFRMDRVLTMAESWRRLLESLPWRARAKA